MKAADILAELEPLGTASYKRTMMVHGVREPFYGVKIGDMKKILKRTGANHELALELYDTGVYDAMYLAGLMAEDRRMTRKDLQRWVDKAYCPGLSEYTVPWVAAGSAHAWDVGRAWIDSKKELVASAGWATLSGLAAMTPDGELDLDAYGGLLERVAGGIVGQPNRVRYVMNGFVIAVGSHVKPLTKAALGVAKRITPVKVDMGDTACKIPVAADYIKKVEARGAIGKKRKSIKC
jgi:hypothetical protein